MEYTNTIHVEALDHTPAQKQVSFIARCIFRIKTTLKSLESSLRILDLLF
jgi:hypothetical protein